MTTTLHPLADAYLEGLRKAAQSLARSRREELLADIEAHLAEAAPADASEVDVRSALDRLGDPEQIVAAEAGDPPAAERSGALEWWGIIMLAVGGVVLPFIGWLVGVLLLWISRAWTVREKVIGTLVVPGGLLPAVALLIHVLGTSSRLCRTYAGNGSVRTCTGGTGGSSHAGFLVLLAALFVLPFVTAVYLARRAQSHPAA
jgi:uncharacterized membrane protein